MKEFIKGLYEVFASQNGVGGLLAGVQEIGRYTTQQKLYPAIAIIPERRVPIGADGSYAYQYYECHAQIGLYSRMPDGWTATEVEAHIDLERALEKTLMDNSRLVTTSYPNGLLSVTEELEIIEAAYDLSMPGTRVYVTGWKVMGKMVFRDGVIGL